MSNDKKYKKKIKGEFFFFKKYFSANGYNRLDDISGKLLDIEEVRWHTKSIIL